MGITITDGTYTVTVKPYKIVTQNKYAVQAELGIVVSTLDTPDSVHYDIFAKVPATDLSALQNMTVTVTVTSTVPDVPDGTYYLEAIEVSAEPRLYNYRDIRISMFREVV